MIKSILLYFSLILLTKIGNAQDSDLIEEIFPDVPLYIKKTIQIFDSSLIRKYNIEKAYVINLNKDGDFGYDLKTRDTAFVYSFSKSGRILSQINYGRGIRDTVVFKGQPIMKDNKILVQVSQNTNENVVTKYILWNSKSGFDTAIIRKYIYNKKGNLTEEIQKITKFCKMQIYCGIGAPGDFDRKYSFDSNDRITLIQEGQYTQKINYFPYGIIIEKDFHDKDFPKRNEAILINDDQRISSISFPGCHISYQKERESQLIDLVTLVFDDRPPVIRCFQIEYKFADN